MKPAPPLAFLKTATVCRRCRAPLTDPPAFALCAACDPPELAYSDDDPPDPAAAANRLARRRFDVYAAVVTAAEAAGWTLYRSQRSARSLSLYLEYWRPDAPGDPAAYRKVRVSDHDRRPKPGGAGFAADWADLHAEFLFDPALTGAEAAAAPAAVHTDAAAAFAWPPGTPAPAA